MVDIRISIWPCVFDPNVMILHMEASMIYVYLSL